MYLPETGFKLDFTNLLECHELKTPQLKHEKRLAEEEQPQKVKYSCLEY